MELHKDCGGEIVSELMYSDAEHDYYFPACVKCQRTVETKEVLFEVDQRP